MPRLGDEKEYEGNVIKERPAKGKGDDEKDDIAVYGSDNDDVVTGDEMDGDGNLDPEAGQGMGGDSGDDSALDNIDFGDEGDETDELGDFEDDDDDVDTLEGDDEGDIEASGDEASKVDLFDKLQDVLSQIVDFKGGEDELEDISDEELGEAFVGSYLREDAAFRETMNNFAEQSELEHTDIYKLVSAMESAEASTDTSDVRPEDIQENSRYRVLLSKYKDVKVINIFESVEESDLEEARADAENANESWDVFKRRYAEVLEDPEANLQGERPKEEEKQYLEDLTRKQAVIKGSELIEYVNESKSNPRVYVFVVEEMQGESFVADKKQLSEADAKSLSNKTRKTHNATVAELPFMVDKLLASVLDVQFKGKIKPFTQIHKDLKKGDEKAGHKGGQAAKRRGDKSNGMPMQSLAGAKKEAALHLINTISEMTGPQVSALLRAFDTETKPSDIVSESARSDLEGDFEAIKTAAEGEGLSESFLNDTQIILETAVKTRVDEAARALEVHYNNKLRSEVDAVQEQVVDQLNEYLDYVAENFMEENKLEIEQGNRVEIAESLLANMFKVFKEHNVTVPEGKTDLLDESKAEVDALNEKLETEFKRGMSYKKKAVAWMKEAVIARNKVGLTVKEGNELERRVEAIREFKDEVDFEKKVKDIKRLYFSEETKPKNTNAINNITEQDATLLESSEQPSFEHGSKRMDDYVNQLKKTSGLHSG